MNNNSPSDKYELENSNAFLAALSFIAGLVLGALAGAVTALLIAPQSGKKTRLQIRRKGKGLRKQTAEAVKDGVDQLRDIASEATTSIHEQAENLQQRGQKIVDQQMERWSPVVEAGITAAKD